MDSNGSEFQLLNNAEDFSNTVQSCEWDESQGVFRLALRQQPRFSQLDGTAALAAWENTPALACDEFGQFGLLSEDSRSLHYALDWQSLKLQATQPVLASNEASSAGSAAALSLDPVDAPADARFVDLHLGGDSRVALPYSDGNAQHGLTVVHLAKRWQRRCRLAEAPKRAWVDHLNRIWVASDQWLALCEGEPLPQAYQPEPSRFEAVPLNPNALERKWVQALPLGFQLLAMCADQERLYFLAAHSGDGHQELWARSLSAEGDNPILRFTMPEELPFVIDLAALTENRLALMLAQDGSGHLDLPVIEVPNSEVPKPAVPKSEKTQPLQTEVVGEGREQVKLLPLRYPQHSQAAARFVSRAVQGAIYLSALGPKKLHRLQQARFPTEARVTLSRVLDSGSADTLWHRIYMDACIPSGCDLRVEVKSFEDWSERGDDWQMQSRPLWQSRPSELPFYRSRFSPDKNRHQGLFEIFLQRESGAVREVRGRYLQLRLSFKGDGRHSPAIAAIRVYQPRLSWQQAYLPRHFQQSQRPDGSLGEANAADVRERMIAGFEGMMTPIETQITAAECLLSPLTTPSDRLSVLAAMLGTSLPSPWPERRKRLWLYFQGQLQQYRGTFKGLCLALDIATDGLLSMGRIVPVENYRLRRTLATVLGVDMSDDEHPLTLGTGQSGNSIVGESLILSEEESREFLALFAPELADSPQDKKTVSQFFDRYAHRLSIVMHGDARAYKETIQAVLEKHAPAHLEWRLIETDLPFVLGLSPLLGIDTFLEKQPQQP